MLPSIVARQIHESVRNFLVEQFRVSTKFFQKENVSIVEKFVNAPSNVYKGPWLDIKLPFETSSARVEDVFRHVRPAFAPYAHQRQAYERLSTARATQHSTIIATGTGSGKTECFAYPVLDHCIEAKKQGQKGIKAVIVYPMNALAVDQSRRFAREVHQLNLAHGLTGPQALRVGRYTGRGAHDEERTTQMTPTEVIDCRDTLRDNPPDILLTNYKMLDYLLIRADDYKLWRFNQPGVLRYLIVDELHTFDGAQGTDLACLIRRLRARLAAKDELICVGTSATIGSGESALKDLCDYATSVFSTPFAKESIIGEQRLDLAQYIERHEATAPKHLNFLFNNVAEQEILKLPITNIRKETLMERYAMAWFNEYRRLPANTLSTAELQSQRELQGNIELEDLRFADVSEQERLQARIELGHRLRKHKIFNRFLAECDKVVDLYELAAQWTTLFGINETTPLTIDETLVIIDSLVSLIAYARDANGTDADGNVRTQPMLHVRTQLWMREMRRMVARLGHDAYMLHADDLTRQHEGIFLPLVHCRECLALGWGTVWNARTEPISADLRSFYSQWFNFGSDVQVLYPLDETEQAPTDTKGLERFVCGECGEVHINNPEEGCCTVDDQPVPLVRVWMPHMQTLNKEERAVRDDRCPWCKERNALSIVGSQAASLASVGIAQLFGSNHAEDRKLIAFSDAVQDAAHRAGFFGSRTYRQVSRLALRQAVAQYDQGNLKDFANHAAHYWRSTLGDADFVGTFIAPDMEWQNEYQELLRTNKLPENAYLADRVESRVRWEAMVEFGLRSRLGRTLERARVATVAVNESLLHTVAREILAHLHEHIEGFRSLTADDIHAYVRGLLAYWRQRGAFDVPEMRALVKHRGNTFVWMWRDTSTSLYLPKYGARGMGPSVLLFETDRQQMNESFTPMTTTTRNSSLWSDEWFRRTLLNKEILHNEGESHQIMRAVVDALVRHNILNPADDALRPNAFLLNAESWTFYKDVEEVRCDRCQRRESVPAGSVFSWENTRCMRAGCQGHYSYASTEPKAHDHVTAIEEGDEVPPPTRIVASEHTGLLESETRKKIEEAFIHAKYTWDVNLLSSTPTLEMGIDIGDLSTVLLCSVPPSQANYLQRIGRAGRRDGNALSMVIANAVPHDNYFYAQPIEMMDGVIHTPGVYLQALAVLERQLTAYAFDNWCNDAKGNNQIPVKLQTVLDSFKKEDTSAFPHTLFDYIDRNKEVLIEGFLELFQDLGEQGEAHLRQFLIGDSSNESLRFRITNKLLRVLQTRENFGQRILEAQRAERTWKAKPDDEAKKAMLQELADERKILQALRQAINRQHTLNFFTDEGVLPNYAFPEEGVTLQSVMVRDTKQDAAQNERQDEDRRYEYREHVFQRSSSSALQEFAPESRFYAAAHQLTIERVDLRESPVETWRLCDQCDYAERVAERQVPQNQCPRCHSEMWSDVGQERQLIRLRQVYAFARAGRDSIDDSHENRHTTFYERQLLVDIPPECKRVAYSIDDAAFPFGFEYLDKVDFRELNFGELTTQGQKFSVAGREAVRQGFQVCKDCGTVRPKRKSERRFHAFDCPVRQDSLLDNDEQYIESLYLYRELRSESLRFLLPISEIQGSELARGSFVAALQLGLRKHFKGNVQHIEATTMAPYAQRGEVAREYVLFYDTVPGGTGYLKDLARDPNNVFAALQKALDTLLACPTCSNDDQRDGCYQCLLAYRNVYSQHDISRQKAIQLIQDLLKKQDSLQTIASVDAIEVNSALESQFEARIVQLLRKADGLEVTNAIVDGLPGYIIHADDLRWELIPQHNVRDPHTQTITTRSDFYLRLVRAPGEEWTPEAKQRFQFQIFADGYQWHYNTVAEDVRKRQTVLSTGHRLWTLTWEDVCEDDRTQTRAGTKLLCVAHPPMPTNNRLAEYLLEHLNPPIYRPIEVRDAQEFLKNSNSFNWLVRMLRDPLATETLLRRAAHLEVLSRTAIDAAPSMTQKQARLPQTVLDWMDSKQLLISGFETEKLPAAARAFDAVQIYGWTRKDVVTAETWNEYTGAALWIDDALIAQSEDYKKEWRAFWTAANVMQFAPTIALISDHAIANHSADAAWPTWPERTLQSSYLEQLQTGLEAADWTEVFDEVVGAQLPVEDLQRLKDAGLDAPYVGASLTHDQKVITEAELCWEEQKIAVLMDQDVTTYAKQFRQWRLVSDQTPDWVDTVIRWFNEGD